MKRIISILVCSLFVGYFAFAVTVEEWRKMPCGGRLSDGTLSENTITKVNQAIELLKNKDLQQKDRVELLRYIIPNNLHYWLTEEEFNKLKPYSDELDNLIGKNTLTAKMIQMIQGKEQQAIAYYQEMVREGKQTWGVYWNLHHLARRTGNETLKINSATETIKIMEQKEMAKNIAVIKAGLPYAYDKLTAEDYVKLLGTDNEELTTITINALQKRSDAKLCRDIISKAPTNSKIIASLKPLCELNKLSTKEQVQFYLILWKANFASIAENSDAKNIVDGAVTCIAQLIPVGTNPSIAQVEKIIAEMK